MKLTEFIENFLPEHASKENKFIEKFCNGCGVVDYVAYHRDTFLIANFPKALENFTNKICEKQRENCARAEQPKIEELCY